MLLRIRLVAEFCPDQLDFRIELCSEIFELLDTDTTGARNVLDFFQNRVDLVHRLTKPVALLHKFLHCSESIIALDHACFAIERHQIQPRQVVLDGLQLVAELVSVCPVFAPVCNHFLVQGFGSARNPCSIERLYRLVANLKKRMDLALQLFVFLPKCVLCLKLRRHRVQIHGKLCRATRIGLERVYWAR